MNEWLQAFIESVTPITIYDEPKRLTSVTREPVVEWKCSPPRRECPVRWLYEAAPSHPNHRKVCGIFFFIPICLLENSHSSSSKFSLYCWTAESGLYNKSALLYHSTKWRTYTTHTYTSVRRTPKSCINQRRYNRCHRHIKIVGHPRWKQNRRSKRSMATIRRTALLLLLLLVEYSTRLIGACVWVEP